MHATVENIQLHTDPSWQSDYNEDPRLTSGQPDYSNSVLTADGAHNSATASGAANTSSYLCPGNVDTSMLGKRNNALYSMVWYCVVVGLPPDIELNNIMHSAGFSSYI